MANDYQASSMYSRHKLEKSTLLEITQWQDNEKCKRTRPCSFQAKLVKYKTEAAEGGSLVEELSAQSRLDQETIRGQRDTIEELRQTAQTDKVMCCVCASVSLSQGGWW